MSSLESCLEYNSDSVGFKYNDVKKVFACIEGERDQSPWYWILQLKDGTCGLLKGDCDYTGWD